MAQQRPAGLVAIHLNFPQVVPDQLPERLSPEQQRALEVLTHFRERGSGYFEIQATRPQTLGYALLDSPAGLAGWLYDIYQRGPDERVAADALSRDAILDEIDAVLADRHGRLVGTLSTSSSGRPRQALTIPAGSSSQWAPASSRRSAGPAQLGRRHLSPPHLLARPDRGGHFAAIEEPTLFARELRAFAHAVRRL